MEEIRPGVVWIATDAQGIVAVDTVGFRTHRIRHDPALPSSLGEGAVFAIHRDRAGLVWVGTDRSLSRHNATQTTVSTIFGASSRNDSVSVADVAAVLEMPNGLIWLGLGNNGIDIIDPAGGRVAALRPNPEQPERALPKKYITALAAANADVYIGTRQGLYRADSAARGVVRVSVPGRLPADDVSTLLNDDGVLWVGGNGGLRGLDLGGSNAAARMGFATTAKLTDQRVSVLGRGSGGSLWVGTENGLNRLDFTSLTVEHITADRADSQALPLGYISSLLIDRRGRLWVGTLGGGIGVLRVDDRNRRARFRRLGLAQGLGNNTIDQLLEDTHGRIWASTDDGIAVIDPDTFAIRMLQNPDGVAILVHWAPAGARTSAGELLFGGAGGLTLIRPDRLEDWSYRPPIVITNVRVGGKLIEGSRFNTPVCSGLPDHCARCEQRGCRVRRSRLLRPGAQPLRVPARGLRQGLGRGGRESAHGCVHEPGARQVCPEITRVQSQRRMDRKAVPVPIHVMPAWFQTFGFRILLGLAGLALLAGLMHIRTTYLRHRQRELERQIADRTASLNQRTEELQESQRQLEADRLFRHADAFAQSPPFQRRDGTVDLPDAGRGLRVRADADRSRPVQTNQ